VIRGILRRARRFRTYKWIAMAAVFYCLCAVAGGNPPTVVNALIVPLLSAPAVQVASHGNVVAPVRAR
jgi:hypothetical protein